MKIAQVAPLWEQVPPPAYGGIELVVSLLTEELVRRGHEVTLFASGDSVSQAKLESVHSRAIRLDPEVKDPGIYEALHLNHVCQQADTFDVVHFHVGHTALPYVKSIKAPVVHTLHAPFTPDSRKLFRYAKEQSYISISEAQIDRDLGLNYVATVHNAIDVSRHQFYAQADEPPYLAFLGRFSPDKGPHHAIAIAKATGIPLKMAGKVDPIDRAFFEREVQPHIDGSQIQFLGEANHAQKNELLGRAIAMLFPITWQEPFGLVMIESMAAGTPVIAMRMGSTPEVIVHGKTGYLCDSVEDCIAAVGRLKDLNRQDCRNHVATQFSVAKMVDGYESVYRSQVASRIAPTNGHVKASVKQDSLIQF
ncbi:MAG: glycosyltransferase family 4 protein [Thermosynechococcaceae cyanobacterium MS004]|nr:glycosyltransferase family 4 protein [Thermosynechococcaceae cyanobacterium MS004]